MDLVIATGNAHKLVELRQMFAHDDVNVLGLDAFDGVPEIIEDGDSFEANAIKKAVTIAHTFHVWALGDDSGLEVRALDWAPGVYSARYAGEPTDDAANNAKLLRHLDAQSDRMARFRCAIALASPDGVNDTVDGSCPGRIIERARGDAGFGYDPLFVPDGYERTFAELASDEKHAISHRGHAIAAARARWWPQGAFMFPGVGR